MSPAPLVSVVMPVKDSGRFVGEAVESVLGQEFADFELVVVDDGSTDDSMEVVRGYEDARIRVVEGPCRGVAAAINQGLESARGELVARMDADDVAESDRLAVQADFLAREESIDAVGSDVLELDEEGKVIARFAALDHPDLARVSLLVENPLLHSSVTVRRQRLVELGGYAETASEDYELWCRLARAGGRLTNVPATLVRWRWHERAVTKENASGVRRSALETYSGFREWFLKTDTAMPEVRADELCAGGDRLGPLARRLAWVYARLGAFYFDAGDSAGAVDAFTLSRENSRLCRDTALDVPLRASYPRRRAEVWLKSNSCPCNLARGIAGTLFPYRPLER